MCVSQVRMPNPEDNVEKKPLPEYGFSPAFIKYMLYATSTGELTLARQTGKGEGENKKERKLIIMQSLAGMLEERELMKITTAELAKRSEITEAAIYKHFPSKRKIFEELVVFFEESIFSRINGIKEETKADEFPGQLISLILKFCEMNKGFSRILTREVFTVDEAKISDKVSNCFEKISVEIRQSLQDYERTTKKKLNLNLSSTCDLLISCLEGQIQSFVRSRFKKDLSSEWQEQWIFLKKSIYPS